VVISQSGESIEPRKIVEHFKGSKRMVVIVNNTESSMAKNSSSVLPLMAGTEEKSATKTYTNTLGLLMLLSEVLGGFPLGRLKNKLRKMVRCIDSYLAADRDRLKEAVGFLGNPQCVSFISRGYSFATASQGALLFKEVAHILAESITGGTFRHGPFEAIDENFRAIIPIGAGKTSHLMLNMAFEICTLGGRVILVTNEKDIASNNGIKIIYLPVGEEKFFPMLDIIPIELMAIELAKIKGLEAGDFSYGHKVTTRE